MTDTATESQLKQSMVLLSHLLLCPMDGGRFSLPEQAELELQTRNVSREQFDSLVALADSNHVIVRGLEIYLDRARNAQDTIRAEWALAALAAERTRIRLALVSLEEICAAFAALNYDVTVIKSLDHWPDLGSDLDLYSNTNPQDIFRLMTGRFNAQISPQSWGDRLACKWNFLIPGLKEAVEIHMGRLGQTGEQVSIAARLAQRTRLVQIGNQVFRVCSVSDRLMISTMQRMYRHFYFRLCDIVDTAELASSGSIDYGELRSLAMDADIWEGVATYLAIVSDYLRKYSGKGLELPSFVVSAARFGGETVYFAREFLRVPIMPQSAGLYVSQMGGVLRKRELQNGARLGLLPWLATAALVGQKFTGSDKGIW